MGINIALSGATGRMGQAISHEADLRNDVAIQSIFGEGLALDGFFDKADVVIDFSRPEATAKLAQATSRPMVVGTTGLDVTAMDALQKASQHVPILIAANTSLGVAVMRHLAKEAARILGDDYDVSVTDIHHKAKLDAPSGTALAIEDAVKQGRAMAEVQHSSHRIGTVAGDHTVHFAGPSERLEIRHIAEDRSLFAKGAIRAAIWLAQQKPGLYSMDDVIKG